MVTAVDALLASLFGNVGAFLVEVGALAILSVTCLIWLTERRRTPYLVPAAPAAVEVRRG